MSLSQNPGSHESEEEQGKSLQSVQQAFVEKAFCIVGNEMKAKMEALGLNEDDLINNLYEREKNKKITGRLGDDPPEEAVNEYLEIASQDTKRGLKDLITRHEEFSILFSHFPKERVQVLISCRERNRIFDLIMSLRSGIEKYNFSWDLLIEFFEKVPREVQTSISDQGKSIRSINLLIGTYLVLLDSIKQETLFDDLIKISLSTGKENVGRMLMRLETLNSEYKKYISDNYESVINLLILAGSNSIALLNMPGSIGKTVNFIKKNKERRDLIISGLEKLGPDFIYVIHSNSCFIQETLKRFPERFIEFCENLKKLADFSKNNEVFYKKSLDFITQFVIDHPDDWEYLLKIGEIFGKNTPGIFSIGKGFINELFKYFPEDYEEILLEVRDVGEHIYGNEGSFLTWGIKFLAKFLEKGKEDFFKVMYKIQDLNNYALKQNHNTGGIFFEDGLNFATKYLLYFPGIWTEIGERIVNIINKHYSTKITYENVNFLRQFMGGFDNFINNQIIDQNPKLLDELLNFLDRVGGSKDALRIIKSLSDFVDIDDINTEGRPTETSYQISKESKASISYSLAYLLKHKKSKIIPFIQNLNLIKDLNLGININQVLLGGVSLECKSNEELQELFAGENAESTKIWKYFVRIGGKTPEDVQRWIVQIKQAKKIDKTKAMPYLIKIQNVFAESLLDNLEKIIHQKIHLKFRREFKLSKDFNDSLLNENLFEFYKMYSSTTINKTQAFELIQRYLNGEVYTGSGNVLQTYPYNIEENKEFLHETLKDRTNIWLSRNEEIYDIEEASNREEKVDNISEQIAHHLKVANDKLELLEIKDRNGKIKEYKNHIQLINFFELLRKDKEKYDTNLFDDLEFQVNSIKDLLKTKSTKKVTKIKIYHELEPLKIAMMGNWVDGSCLSYYSTVGNYWSAITNALEVNKGVFYIEDEHGNVIARVLVGVNDNGDLDIHPMYLKGNVGINLKEIFYFQYMSELASKLGVTKHGDRNNVKLLFCDNWYSGD